MTLIFTHPGKTRYLSRLCLPCECRRSLLTFTTDLLAHNHTESLSLPPRQCGLACSCCKQATESDKNDFGDHRIVLCIDRVRVCATLPIRYLIGLYRTELHLCLFFFYCYIFTTYNQISNYNTGMLMRCF